MCVIRDTEGKSEAEAPEEIMNKNFLKQIKEQNKQTKKPPNHSSKTPGETQAKQNKTKDVNR